MKKISIETIKNGIPLICNFLYVNFYLNNKWGHFSSIVAYNENNNRFLLMDVGMDTSFIWVKP